MNVDHIPKNGLLLPGSTVVLLPLLCLECQMYQIAGDGTPGWEEADYHKSIASVARELAKVARMNRRAVEYIVRRAQSLAHVDIQAFFCYRTPATVVDHIARFGQKPTNKTILFTAFETYFRAAKAALAELRGMMGNDLGKAAPRDLMRDTFERCIVGFVRAQQCLFIVGRDFDVFEKECHENPMPDPDAIIPASSYTTQERVPVIDYDSLSPSWFTPPTPYADEAMAKAAAPEKEEGQEVVGVDTLAVSTPLAHRPKTQSSAAVPHRRMTKATPCAPRPNGWTRALPPAPIDMQRIRTYERVEKEYNEAYAALVAAEQTHRAVNSTEKAAAYQKVREAFACFLENQKVLASAERKLEGDEKEEEVGEEDKKNEKEVSYMRISMAYVDSSSATDGAAVGAHSPSISSSQKKPANEPRPILSRKNSETGNQAACAAASKKPSWTTFKSWPTLLPHLSSTSDIASLSMNQKNQDSSSRKKSRFFVNGRPVRPFAQKISTPLQEQRTRTLPSIPESSTIPTASRPLLRASSSSSSALSFTSPVIESPAPQRPAGLRAFINRLPTSALPAFMHQATTPPPYPITPPPQGPLLLRPVPVPAVVRTPGIHAEAPVSGIGMVRERTWSVSRTPTNVFAPKPGRMPGVSRFLCR